MRYTINDREVSEEEWDSSLEDGVYRTYDNGQVVSEFLYKGGKKHGVVRHWYGNGQIEREHPYRDGKHHGTSKEWDYEGNLTYEHIYYNGKRVPVNNELVRAVLFGEIV